MGEGIGGGCEGEGNGEGIWCGVARGHLEASPARSLVHTLPVQDGFIFAGFLSSVYFRPSFWRGGEYLEASLPRNIGWFDFFGVEGTTWEVGGRTKINRDRWDENKTRNADYQLRH